MRILLVEKDTKVLQEVRLRLERRNHTVIAVRSFSEGIRVGQVDLIIGEVEAIGVARALRHDGRYIPLIVLTDDTVGARKENERHGHRKVAHHIVPKPFILADLVQKSTSVGAEL